MALKLLVPVPHWCIVTRLPRSICVLSRGKKDRKGCGVDVALKAGSGHDLMDMPPNQCVNFLGCATVTHFLRHLYGCGLPGTTPPDNVGVG